jgi:aryl-alcohol dehydrogenase-like predicted oxidoreductase
MFHHRLGAAFSALEDAVEMDKIRYYGLATWNGFRLSLGERDYLSLSDVVKLARDIAGDGHHLRFLQLPFNLAMPEAFGLGNQDGLSGDQPHEPALTLFEAAREAGIAVVGSATLYQGQLTHGLPEFIGQRLGGSSDSENAIQFARSAPGLTTALIGMSRREHVAANLKAALRPLASVEQWTSLFSEE